MLPIIVYLTLQIKVPGDSHTNLINCFMSPTSDLSYSDKSDSSLDFSISTSYMTPWTVIMTVMLILIVISLTLIFNP